MTVREEVEVMRNEFRQAVVILRRDEYY